MILIGFGYFTVLLQFVELYLKIVVHFILLLLFLLYYHYLVLEKLKLALLLFNLASKFLDNIITVFDFVLSRLSLSTFLLKELHEGVEFFLE